MQHKLCLYDHRRSRIFDWGGGHTINHISEDKKISTVRFRIFDWVGGGRNLVEDQLRIGEGGKPKRENPNKNTAKKGLHGLKS